MNSTRIDAAISIVDLNTRSRSFGESGAVGTLANSVLTEARVPVTVLFWETAESVVTFVWDVPECPSRVCAQVGTVRSLYISTTVWVIYYKLVISHSL